MKVKVYMLAFGKPGEIREVDVPNEEVVEDTDALLESVFYYGQNDFQPQQHPSVSVGDVVELDSKYYLVMGIGFKEITQAELQNYMQLDRRGRMLETMKE
jgi:hypothetical protein